MTNLLPSTSPILHCVVSSYANLLLLLLLLGQAGQGRAYPGGVPDMSCLNMLPTGHGVEPMSTSPPFKIFVSKKSYKPGETLQVVMQAEGENYFRGLILQARVTGCNVTEDRVVGTFTSTDTELETKHCFGEIHSTVSHNSATKKRLKTFYWTAPVISSGHLVMRATVLREFQEYWVNVQSDIVADLHSRVTSRCFPLPPHVTTDRSLALPSDSSSTPGTSGTGTVGSTEQTSQDGKFSAMNTSDKKYPSWLGPSFEKKPKPAEEASGGGDPSWLIPAYQRASSAASPAHPGRPFCSIHVQTTVLAIVHLLWTLTRWMG